MAAKCILERLDAGETIISDGGFLFALEKRGYTELPTKIAAVIENPDAVLQLHKDFVRAGAGILTTFSFNTSDDIKIKCNELPDKDEISALELAKKSVQLAKKAAEGKDVYVAAGMSESLHLFATLNKDEYQIAFEKQVKSFVEMGVDILICEYFQIVEEAVWAVEVCKRFKLPVFCTLCSYKEDIRGVPISKSAIDIVKAGADVIGINCRFDPETCLIGMKTIKDSLEEAGLKAHLFVQPVGCHIPERFPRGFCDLPEFPYALEPRILTRQEVRNYARDAYKMGIRIIGGCCLFEPYHIRAIAQELALETGKEPQGSMKGGSLKDHTDSTARAKASEEYWQTITPATGRVFSPVFAKPLTPEMCKDF